MKVTVTIYDNRPARPLVHSRKLFDVPPAAARPEDQAITMAKESMRNEWEEDYAFDPFRYDAFTGIQN